MMGGIGLLDAVELEEKELHLIKSGLEKVEVKANFFPTKPS
jgi:hypothetical protein